MTIHLPTRSTEDNGPGQPRPRGGSGYDAYFAVAILVAVLAIATLIGILLFNNNDDDGGGETVVDTSALPSSTEPSAPTLPSSTVGPSQTSQPSTTPSVTQSGNQATTATTSPSTTASTTASSVTASSQPPSDIEQPVVWPQTSSELSFTTPEAAARSFAEGFAGFAAPVLGDFRAGDGRSGEIEVQPILGGPVTTILLRQVGPDDSWAVIAAVNENIVIDQPGSSELVGQPMTLTGKARAFEGTVQFELYIHGQTEPVAAGFVTGRGDGVLGPFTTTVDWPPELRGPGTLILFTESAENGQTWDVAAIPLRFS